MLWISISIIYFGKFFSFYDLHITSHFHWKNHVYILWGKYNVNSIFFLTGLTVPTSKNIWYVHEIFQLAICIIRFAKASSLYLMRLVIYKWGPLWFRTVTNSPILRTADRVFSTDYASVISFRQSDILRKMR